MQFFMVSIREYLIINIFKANGPNLNNYRKEKKKEMQSG
jgi:hypothetical protein